MSTIKQGTVNFNNPISVKDAFKLIVTNGESKTYYIQGEPGIGKSTLHTMVKDYLGEDEWDHIYLDASLVDYGELVLRAPNRDTGELELFITSLLKPKSGKKKCIMIDELDKCDKLLQKLFTRMFLDHVIGDFEFKGIVFATGNLGSDGVGNSILAHTSNRVTTLNMRKPTHTEWLAWATEKRISPEIRAFVAMTPSVMASYLDGITPESNPHVFFPSHRNKQFCSPRSLALCDPDVRNRDKLGTSLTKAALAGTIGGASAELMSAVLSLKDEIVTTEDVIKNPDTVSIPEKQAALFLMMFNAVDVIQTQDDLSSFMKFMTRVPSSEVQSVFFTMAMANKRLSPIASKNTEITKWLEAGNYKLMA
jgi:hypothetical protein